MGGGVVIFAILGLILAALGLFTSVQVRRIEARYPPAGERVDVVGGAIHVVEAPALGEERGTVLLLHGASGTHADLTVPLSDRLAALGFRVVAVDRPGHGWSSRILGRRASSPARQAEWIRAALASRGIEQAIVVGHSLAGVLALALALDAPQFVRALALLAPVSHPWPGGVNWYYALSTTRGIGWAFRRFVVMPLGLFKLPSGVRGVFDPCPAPENYAEATGLALMLRPGHFKANAEDVADLKGFVIGQSRRYGEIRAPTEIVTGDGDRIVTPEIHSAGCARDIPGARLTMLPGIGHSPHHSAPDVVIAAILAAERRAIEGEGRVADRERRFEPTHTEAGGVSV